MQAFISTIANRHGLATMKNVAIIVFDLAKGPFVNHALISFETNIWIGLVSHYRNRTKLNSFHGLPRLGFAFGQKHPLKAGCFKLFEELILAPCARDTS